MKRTSSLACKLGGSLVVLAACGGGPNPPPVHPSAAQYEAAAAREEGEAKEHEKQYKPEASVKKEHCPPIREGTGSDMCWTADENPTARHLAEAEQHRKSAAKFRAESQVMRDTEAKACAGLSEHDRDTSPFAHTEDIVNIQPLDVSTKKGAGLVREGVVFTFRPVPGMTLDLLQRVVGCHLARNDAMGHKVPDMDYCPLVPPNVQASVKQTSVGFDVEVSSGDKPSIAEIQRRADLLQKRRLVLQEAKK